MTRRSGNPSRLTRALALAASAALGAAPASYADGGITTPQIIAETVSAFPSCLNYQVTGVCYFLTCELYFCEITYSIKIKHAMPDDVVSTYSSPDQHPWTDYGKLVATMLHPLGDSMMGSATDAQTDTWSQRPNRETIVLAKSADAIGNPVAALLGGGGGALTYPDFTELSQFASTELPRIAQLWAQAPSNLANSTLANGKAMFADASKYTSQITSLPSQFGSLLKSTSSSIGSFSLSDLTNMSFGGTSSSSNASSSSSGAGGSSQSPVSFGDLMKQATQEMGQATGTGSKMEGIDSSNWQSYTSSYNEYICPGSASMFGVDYDSDLDDLFWRDKVPLEELYPASWIPGLAGGDVTQSGVAVNTWDSIYPRINQLVQSDPVKASAVIASRVDSIISQAAQPHIYKRLKGKGSKHYFGGPSNPKWQMLYPVPSKSCITFGANDSLSATAYGDGKTSANNGYVWNLWHTWECCQSKGAFLFSVP